MMAPPRKRRRLLDSWRSSDEMSLFEPIPTLRHEVNNLEYNPDTYGPRTVPKRIEEVHLHIQKRAIKFKADEKAELQRRQTAYAITTIDANGNTIISTLTAGLNAGAATSTGPTAITTTATHSRDTTTSSNKSTNSSDRTVSVGSVSVAAASTNSTSSGNESTKNVYLATLSNGSVKTITRSPKPYVTTFGDGEKSTICGRDGQCRLSPGQSSGAAVGSAQSSAAAVSSSSSDASNNDNGGGGTPISTIAGGVVGGLAGLALILVLILLFLRWYKRRLRNGHQALARDGSPTPDSADHLSSGPPGMSERSSLTPFAGAVPTSARGQYKSLEDPASSERSFAKVSGRKMPSAFGEDVAHRDMNSPPPEMPLTGAAAKDLQGTSFYRDSSGFYGGDGAVSPEESQHSDQAPAALTLSPGPQRRPTIHEPGAYATVPSSSTPSTPAHHARSASGPGLSPFIDRSETPPTMTRSETPSTIPDNRSSRFTEDF